MDFCENYMEEKAIFHLSKKVARKKSKIESYLFDFEKSSRSILVIAQ